MKIQDVRDGFSLVLGDYFQEKGFSLRKANFEYVKKINKNNAIFRIEIHKQTEWFLVTPSVFIGCPQINKIYNAALNMKNPVSGSTCGFGIDNKFNHTRGRYGVEDERSLKETAVLIKKDFDEVVLPWFEEVNSLESIDRYMNFRKDGKFKPGSTSYACLGVIAAKLVNNPSLEDIFKDYCEFYSNYKHSIYLEPIKVVKKYLDEVLYKGQNLPAIRFEPNISPKYIPSIK